MCSKGCTKVGATVQAEARLQWVEGVLEGNPDFNGLAEVSSSSQGRSFSLLTRLQWKKPVEPGHEVSEDGGIKHQVGGRVPLALWLGAMAHTGMTTASVKPKAEALKIS